MPARNGSGCTDLAQRRKNGGQVLLTTTAIIAMLALLGQHARGVARMEAPAAAGQPRRVAVGLWGGEHVRMVVSDVGARLEYDCASGTVDQPMILDARGRFDVRGSYTLDRGGPRRQEQAAAGRARYVGRVDGNMMRLTVTLATGNEPVGVFTLTRDQDPLLTKCR